MVESTNAGKDGTFQTQEEILYKKLLEGKQQKPKLSSIRLQPFFPESSNEKPGKEPNPYLIQASQTPLPDIPLTPGSGPSVTPIPEVPATPEPEIPATPQGNVTILPPSSPMPLTMIAVTSFLHVLQTIKEEHAQVWQDTEGEEGKKNKRSELLPALASWLIAAMLALFVSYYLASR